MERLWDLVSRYDTNGYGNIWSTSLELVIYHKLWKLGGVIFSVGWPAKDRSNMRNNIGKKYLSWDHSKTHAYNLISENFKIVFSLQISVLRIFREYRIGKYIQFPKIYCLQNIWIYVFLIYIFFLPNCIKFILDWIFLKFTR